MKNNFLKNNTGFTLVETLVAIAIFSISILGILSVLASSITDVTYAKEKTIAGYLAQEGIEYMRNIRDNDVLYPANGSSWTAFSTTSSLASCIYDTSHGIDNRCGFNSFTTPTNLITFFKCSVDPTEPAPSPGCILYLNSGTGIYNDYNDNTTVDSNSGFTRKVWMTVLPGGNEVQIFSEVDWNQGTGTANVIFSENLFNWES
jgi:prepilin-type N-terminal cleavage/methylation domain-containing protein